jgi:nicotinamide-nucleotide amidase
MYKSQTISPLVVAEILTIGDELNRGEITDTNAAWLADQLSGSGFDVRYRSGVGDRPADMTAALTQAAGRSQVVIVTGGLGPTSDDLTVDVLAELLHTEPVEEPAHRERLLARFAERGLALTPNNLRQVRIPREAQALTNRTGLAPGFCCALKGAQIFVLPGVPREMKPMFQEQVLPRLRAFLDAGLPAGGRAAAAARRTYRVIGMGESHVDHRLRDLLEQPLPDGGEDEGRRRYGELATLHYRLAFPEILVTLVVRGQDQGAAKRVLDHLDPEVRRRLGGALYSEGQDDLPVVVGRTLRERGATLATAESCTGGMIGEMMTAVPGSSAYFLGGVISYANEVKRQVLGVREQTLQEHGAVSEACVREMAEGVRRLTGATYGVAVSGIAGPEGGTPDKPVGTVHLAVAGPDEVVTRRVFWPGDREQVRRIASCAALNVLHKVLVPERRVPRSDPSDRSEDPPADRLG